MARLLKAAEVRQKVSPLGPNQTPSQGPLSQDESLDEVFRRRQHKSMAKAQQMMEKMGWQKGERAGRGEGGLLTPLELKREGINEAPR